MSYEEQDAYCELKKRQEELKKADEVFSIAHTEFKNQSVAREELAEFMQKHRLHIHCEKGKLEIVQSTFLGDKRVIYSTSTKTVYPIDMVQGDLDAEQA